MRKTKLIMSLATIGVAGTVMPTTLVACSSDNNEIEGARKVTMSLNLGVQLLGTYSLTVAKQDQNNVNWFSDDLPNGMYLSKAGSMPSIITATVLTLGLSAGEQPNQFSFTLKATFQDKTYSTKITVYKMN